MGQLYLLGGDKLRIPVRTMNVSECAESREVLQEKRRPVIRLAAPVIIGLIVLAFLIPPASAAVSGEFLRPKPMLVIRGAGYVQMSKRLVPVLLRLVYEEDKGKIGIPEQRVFNLMHGYMVVGFGRRVAFEEGRAIVNPFDRRIWLSAKTGDSETEISLSGTFTTFGHTLRARLSGTMRSGAVAYPLFVLATGEIVETA